MIWYTFLQKPFELVGLPTNHQQLGLTQFLETTCNLNMYFYTLFVIYIQFKCKKVVLTLCMLFISCSGVFKKNEENVKSSNKIVVTIV